jgi:hypothetical protein
MKRRRTRSPFAKAVSTLAATPLARTALPAAGFLLACLLPAILPADWFHTRLWRGYYTVILAPAPQSSAPPAQPASWGSIPPVSRHSASVSFNTFAGMTSVRVVDLPDRLEGADPRLDPYLQRVGAWFHGSAGELAYVRTRLGPLVSGLGRLAPGWQVLELDPGALLIRLVFAACAAFLVLLPARVPNVPRWLLGLGLLPWGLRVATGDLRDLLAFLLLFPLWVRAMSWAAARQLPSARRTGPKRKTGKTRRRSRKPRRRAFLPAALGPLFAALDPRQAAVRAALVLLGAAVFLLATPGVRHLPGALFALAADLCLLALLPAARRWERSRRTHTLFRALPILGSLRAKSERRRQRPSIPGLVVPAALALLALASAAALSLEARRRDLSAPRLEHTGTRGLSWAALAAVPLTTDPQGLPHLADFLAHTAYQQSLAFQRPYRFPTPGERVYISGYAVTADGYVQSLRVARRFPESWVRQTLAAAPPGSLERMLIDQGRAAAVERVGEPRLLRELEPWRRAAAVALFMLACLTAAIWSGTRTFAL